MAGTRKSRTILQRQLDARAKLWPEIKDGMLWHMDNEGWIAVPRLMPLMMSIMDDMSGKGFPVGRTYFEMWARLREEGFLTLNRPEEMAFHAGFEGQRALRTWKDRVKRLHELGFIQLKDGPLGEFSYAIFFNPYHVIKRAYLEGKIQERKWQALTIRSNELSIYDTDEIDDRGQYVVNEDSDAETSKPATRKSTRRRKPRST